MAVRGKVKWFRDSKGYGFIEDEDGREIFEHFNEVVNECYKTSENRNVVFDSFTDPKGPNAPHVVKLPMAPLKMIGTGL